MPYNTDPLLNRPSPTFALVFTRCFVKCTSREINHTGFVPHPGDKIKIPLDEKTAIRAFFQVKPTKDMPRPGASNPRAKPKQHWVKKGGKAACGALVTAVPPNKQDPSKITCRSCLALLAREDIRKDQEAIRNR